METIDVWQNVQLGIVDPTLSEDWNIYYDETNNIGKFRFDKDKLELVNDSRGIYRDFMLGGIAIPPGVELDTDSLVASLKINKLSELKAKSFFKTNDFRYDMGSRNVVALLDWLVRSPVYIHYHCFDNIYDAVVEIVDESLEAPYGKSLLIYHAIMKDCFYQLVMNDPREFISILGQYGYPNVSNTDKGVFCHALVSFIEEWNDVENRDYWFFNEVLRQNLKAISKQTSFIQLNFGERGIWIDGYSHAYWYCMFGAPLATHHFDEEYEIIRKFETIDFRIEGKPYVSFEFIDSKYSLLIQISDVVVGLLERYFNWIDEHDDEYLNNEMEAVTQSQLKSFQILHELIDRVDSRCPYLISNMVPHKRRMFYLELLSQESSIGDC
ncbi:DUF3800 domain-containing protein [Candidatus Methanoprimaticola sp. MG2]|uniref:DUF3800 domain-containing protein n=1 Tax=Candidatus Methanoprimaticola sp. MG2 TaxID=3228838 RepID=UPI0039C6CE00